MRIALVTRSAPMRWLRGAPPAELKPDAATTSEAGPWDVGTPSPGLEPPFEREGLRTFGSRRDGPAAAFDEAVFACAARALPADVLAAFLQTLAVRGRTLAVELQGSEDPSAGNRHLAELAHTLGGSAGMFGFSRLAAAAKRFEYAVHANAPEVARLAADLGDAAEQAVAVVGAKLIRAA